VITNRSAARRAHEAHVRATALPFFNWMAAQAA
jgi:hypothetical protein